jgi:putative flippase GtrA
MSVLTTLYARWRLLVHELAKFGIVGAIATVIDFGISNLLVHQRWSEIVATAISVTVAATFSYFANRHWTFRHRARSGLGREYSLFFVLNGIGLLIAEACIVAVRDGLDKHGILWFNVARVLGLVIGTIFRFTTYKRWVFLAPERAAAAALADGSIAEAPFAGGGGALATADKPLLLRNDDR